MSALHPDILIPASSSAVRVSIIDTKCQISVAMDMVSPTIKGHEILNCPSFSFLVEHPSGRKILFDLGVRKDWENLSPPLVEYAKKHNWHIAVQQDVREQLEQHGVKGEDIEAIIWSHWHWDHIGNPAIFDPATALIVGPGFKNTFLPGYPAVAQSAVLESDFAGREVRELTFDEPASLKIGNFDGFDYFGDGSFYILNAPGHTLGHLSALARVKNADSPSSPSSFIFMGGDCCHHSGEMRPSKYLPLPQSIFPNPLVPGSHTPCPGSLFEHLLKDGDRTKPFYDQRRPGIMLCDPDVADQTIVKVQEMDATANVLVVIAHDSHLAGVVDFFPVYADDFAAKGWVSKLRWKFLKDYKAALSVQADDDVHSRM